MNAPLPITVENIEMYADLLDRDFIEETLARHRSIASTRKAIRRSLDQTRDNIQALEKALHNLTDNMRKSADSFDLFSSSSRKQAEGTRDLSVAFHQLSASFSQQARVFAKASKIPSTREISCKNPER